MEINLASTQGQGYFVLRYTEIVDNGKQNQKTLGLHGMYLDLKSLGIQGWLDGVPNFTYKMCLYPRVINQPKISLPDVNGVSSVGQEK